MEPTAAEPAPAPAPEKKSLFETVVISTPVLLTVIATFILGRSSSEMTQAQYQRSVAGQKQSKVADEWAFFQAKRIRGTTYETTSITLLALKADPFTADSLIDTSESLTREIKLTQKETPKLTEPLVALDGKAEASLKQIRQFLNGSSEGKDGKRGPSPDDVKKALAALEAYPEPIKDANEPEDKTDPQQRELLDAILKDVKAFTPENIVAPKALHLKAETIDARIERAKQKAARIAEHGRSIDRVLNEFDVLVDRQAALGREYQRILSAHLSALTRNGGDTDDLAKLDRRLERARNQSARLLGDYKAARLAFDAHRYEDDARSNQDSAFLYDVLVLKSSAHSDQHLKRSFGFMLAMLVAQVGVTVGTLAIMLRRRIPVWVLAALAGLGAIAFAAYILLNLGPMIW